MSCIRFIRITLRKDEMMRERILNYIEKNSRVDLKELAVLLGTTEAEITQELSDMESEGIICGYHTLIDWDKVTTDRVNALIECNTAERPWIR